MISLDKKYKTRSGTTVVIHAIYPHNRDQQVQGAIVYTDGFQMNSWSLEGRFHEGNNIDTSGLDLIEVSPYEDWKIDDKVLVWDDAWDYGVTQKGYFGGLNKNGAPTAFLNGCTSWSTEDRAVCYDNIERVGD
jgi:hypothetical protein